jgi:hypothetical protein
VNILLEDKMNTKRLINLAIALFLIGSFLVPARSQSVVKAQEAATLLSAGFDSGTDGFSYQDDSFGTNQPAYASGAHTTSGGYGGGGGLQITLGGGDANVISGMSGGWIYTLNLAGNESGVVLSFRYKLQQTATYEYDEYSRMLVKVDGVPYGRGLKSFIDHVGGDGSSTQGNSSSYLPTTDWQQHQIYLGDLPAGNHTLVLGGLNNKKDASDESTTLVIDDVVVTSGNAAPATTPAETLASRVDINQYLNYIRGVAQFDDRCRGSGMSCSSTDYVTNYMNALAWVEQQLQAMGYTTVRHNFNYNGNTGTNLWATKMGSVTPTQMYIVSAHLDGRGGGDAFDDDGSGVALALEIARVLSAADVTTDKSVRFAFWDKEELGLYGANGYVQDRRSLQGTTNEPTWLGVIQHDMVLYDHGAGTRTTAQSAYADLDVEWRAGTTKEADSRALALKWTHASGFYAPDYPSTAYNYSTNTDDTPFHPYVASVSVRENRRSLTSGGNAEWINPYYHQTTDVENSYTRDDDSDGKRDDIELGYNAVRTTLGVVAELAGAHVGPANNPPSANPQSVSTNEDTAVAITLTGSDPDNNPLTYTVVSNPAHGVLSGAAPNLTYTPAANYNGPDSFTFKVNDGLVDSTPATVSITVYPINDLPIANSQSVSTNEDTTKAIILTGSDVDGNPLAFNVLTNPGHGTLTGAPPNLTYSPDLNYHGADSFTFKVNDGTADSTAATVSITVNPVNDSPVADAQSVTTAEDTPANITLTGSDVDGNPLTYAVVTQPGHGALAGTAPYLIYTPAANYNGADSFTFKVNDGSVDSAPAMVDLTVTALNDAPVADSQVVSTAQDTPVGITLTGSDVDGDPLTFTVETAPQHGTLSGAAPDILYTPDPGYQGADSFTFTATDGQLVSVPATLDISVTRLNQVPSAHAQSVSTPEDTPLVITLTASDPDADPLTYMIVSGPVNGTLSGAAPDLTYTPQANFNGTDSFTFKVNDGLADSPVASVDITVSPVNDAPLANSQSVSTAEDSPVNIALSGSDVDGDGLIYIVVSQPVNGVLSGTAPDLTYTPAANFNGQDSFTFKVNDGALDSPAATVDITVTPVNDVPLADSQSVLTAEDTSLAITLTGSDVEGSSLAYSLVASPSHGSLSGTAPNLTYTPALNYHGQDSFTFKVSDGQAESAAATVSITVTPVNDTPVATPQSVVTQQEMALAISLAGADADGDALVFSVLSGPSNGALSGTAPNLTYTPNPGYTGSDSFTFVANDGQVDSTPAAVDITVNPNGPYLYLGSSTSGTAGGVSFADEDILVENESTGVWTMFFDGSDVGVSSVDVDAFDLQSDGSLLVSFDAAFTLTDFGSVDDSDILCFVPTSTGATTAGAWQWYFDGSDVGLSTSDEDIDAFTVLPDGRLLISTLGSVSVSEASGADEDLLVFSPTQLGSTTSGTWALYFDGSDVGLSSTSNEDVNGVWVDSAGKIYLTTMGSFSVSGVSGDGSDIFVCTPGTLGSSTTCTFSMYWDGSANGFSGEDTDAFSIVP